MRLRDIVPSQELCKRLPEGVFEDSIFCWYKPNFSEWCVVHAPDKETKEAIGRKHYFPAPTTDEILEDMPATPDLEIVMRWHIKKDLEKGFCWKRFEADAFKDNCSPVEDKKPADVLMKLYLLMHRKLS